MSIYTPSGGGTSTGGGSTISSPTIANETATLATTEYSYALPSGTKFFRLKARNNAKLQLAYVATETSTNYLTVSPGFEYESPQFEIDTSITVYFQSSKAATVIEIESWQ